MSFFSFKRCLDLPKGPFSSLGLGAVRTATKRAGGTVRNHGGSPGQRLGIKKFAEQYVIPGNIIVRQRGTWFHPGQHAKMGKDHTIYATVPGFVRYYKEFRRTGDRKYVGVVPNKNEKLPRDEAAQGRSRYSHLVNLTQLAKENVVSS
ncbi:ribosomal L27 protein-domain-containing protein [Irpex rosettiformis]|uniref:Ribosomal L27 protein-domain-containing protein n=1 Tax=Irpex rosettiformis TaxID=378272 RepID=A0ACB8UHX1_9APHY|nr:ribosomal L27 protein-domain-containing protein [Irpex rosettiformis]